MEDWLNKERVHLAEVRSGRSAPISFTNFLTAPGTWVDSVPLLGWFMRRCFIAQVKKKKLIKQISLFERVIVRNLRDGGILVFNCFTAFTYHLG